jgi:hypothetical protein
MEEMSFPVSRETSAFLVRFDPSTALRMPQDQRTVPVTELVEVAVKPLLYLQFFF